MQTLKWIDTRAGQGGRRRELVQGGRRTRGTVSGPRASAGTDPMITLTARAAPIDPISAILGIVLLECFPPNGVDAVVIWRLGWAAKGLPRCTLGIVRVRRMLPEFG